MIKNGYFVPRELFHNLVHFNIHTDNIHNVLEEIGKEEMEKQLIGDCGIGVAIGNRTSGKTVGIARELLKRWERYGETSLICPRFQKQVDNGSLRKWWEKSLSVNDDEGYFENFRESHKITYDKNFMKVDGNICSYCYALTSAFKVKDEGSFKRCTKMIVDEAILPHERTLLLTGHNAMTLVYTIWQTMARGWELAPLESSIIFISNTTERDNWLFNDLGINKFFKENTKKTRQNGIYIEKVESERAKDDLQRSAMGKIMELSASGKDYKESAMANKFGDNTAFVQWIGLDFNRMIAQFLYQDKVMGLFKCGFGYHVAEIEEKKRTDTIALDIPNHTEENTYRPDTNILELLRGAYFRNILSFQTQVVKNTILRVLGLE